MRVLMGVLALFAYKLFCIFFMVNQRHSLEHNNLFKENITGYFSKLFNTPEQILFVLMLCFLAL